MAKEDSNIEKVFHFSLSSIMSFLVDYSMFFLFSLIIPDHLIICNVLARIISSSFNFTINRKYVFKSQNNIYASAFYYFLLALFILTFNSILLRLFVYRFLINKFIAKIIVEIVLFVFSFIIQKKVVFNRK